MPHAKPITTKREALHKSIPDQQKTTQVTVTSVGTFPSSNSGFIIAHIHALSSDQAYVWHYSDKHVMVANKHGGIEKTLRLDAAKCDVIDVSVSPHTGNLWYSCGDGAIVEMLKDDSNVGRFNVGVEPRCLCVASKNRILVGLECNVMVFKTNGQKLTDLKKQNPSVDLAEFCPSKIAQCPYTECFCICDFFHHYLVLFDSSLRILWTFRGSTLTDAKGDNSETGYTSPDLFWPFMAAFDKDGSIIIGNKGDNNALLVIQHDGHFVQVISREEDEPYALCLHKDGYLWVGLDTRQVKVYKLNGKHISSNSRS